MSRMGYVLSGLAGGLVVLVLGAVLIAADVIDTGGDTKTVVRQGAVATPTTPAKAGGKTVADIYKTEGRGVVFVSARGVQEESSLFGLPQEQEGTATGSGFLVDSDGTIVTNAHVVQGSSDVTVSFDEGGDQIEAEVKGRDPSTDLAVLKVDPEKMDGAPPVPLGDSDAAQVGDAVVAIGNPFGFTRTVTTGIVSAVAREIKAPNGFSISNVIQTDASVNPGNSGGPLMDANGRVIGINSQIATGGGSGSVGIAFAIPINTAKRLLPQLRSGGEIERAYLGVVMSPVTSEIASDLNLPTQDGVLVTCVTRNGPADKAGLRGGRTGTATGIQAGGDLIVEVDGRRVSAPEEVSAAIDRHEPGDEIKVVYYRGDDRRTATVELGKRPADSSTGGCEAAPTEP
jgi:S1-C subfamily serine protease